jgi:3-oxoacyl-[acyl-carrier-protein] synthase-3
VVTNEELGRRLCVPPGWISERTGISTRHIAGTRETTASLASDAGAAALEMASVDPDAVDCIIVATSTPDFQLPATASLVQHALGCGNAGAFDVGAACTGFLYALAQAAAQIESGAAGSVLVIGSETLSRITDHSDAKSCVLFGDGAGAVVVQESVPSRIGPFLFRSDGAYLDSLYVRSDERLIRMEGREVYRHAVEAMAGALSELLERAAIASEDVDLVVAHQANGRILDAVAGRLDMDRNRFAVNIGTVGNTSAASIPLALADAVAHGRLADGHRVALTAFGAGFTWGAGLLDWGVPQAPSPAQPRIPALVGTVGHLLEVL